MGRTALPGLVRVDPALNPPLHRHAYNGTKAGIQTQGAANDQFNHCRELLDVRGHHHKGDNDISHRHHRHDNLRKVCNALDATKDNRRNTHSDH